MQLTPNEIINRYGAGERRFEDLDLRGMNLGGTSLRGASFSRSDLSNALFDNADLSECDFSNANLERASFVNAVLRGTKFEGANLSFAVLRAAFLDNTDLSKSNLQWAHLCRDDLSRCNIKDANLSWSCLVDTGMNEQQMAAIPTAMLGTIRRVEEEHVPTGPQTVMGAGYKVETAGPALGGGYQPIRKTGAEGGYKGLEPGDVGYSTAKIGFDPLRKKQNDNVC